jgi:hypothetical protein
MRPTTLPTLLLVLLAVFTLAAGPLEAQNASDLDGAWIVTGWTSPEGVVDETPQRGVFLFTITRDDGGSYSMMFVSGTEPRSEYSGDQQTGDEKIQAYDSFTANSGRLTVQGTELTYEAYMAKDPNYMASFGENGATATWDVDGDTLTLSFTSGFMDGGSATFRRPTSGE